MTEHRKHLKAGPAACWLWVCGIAYCQRQLSDGFIPHEALTMLGVLRGAKNLAEQLVAVGLFDSVDGGYLVHDYHDYNDTREEAKKRKADLSAVRAQAGRIGGLKSGSKKQANLKQVAEAKRSPIPSHPIPSHKEKEPQVFDDVWETFKTAYPGARREGGLMNNQLFISACERVGFPALIDALQKQKRSETWKKGFVPSMQNWLEKEMWIQDADSPEDEQAESLRKAQAHLAKIDAERATRGR